MNYYSVEENLGNWRVINLVKGKHFHQVLRAVQARFQQLDHIRIRKLPFPLYIILANQLASDGEVTRFWDAEKAFLL